MKEDLKSGKLTVSHIELLQKVPPEYIEDEAKTVVKRGLNLAETEAYLTTQQPIYRIHQKSAGLEERKASSLPCAKIEKPHSFFKLHESRIRGRTEPDFKLESLELVTASGRHIQLFQEIRQALRKLSVGDEAEVSVTIWALAKPKPRRVS